jgi:hypothetical protein
MCDMYRIFQPSRSLDASMGSRVRSEEGQCPGRWDEDFLTGCLPAIVLANSVSACLPLGQTYYYSAARLLFFHLPCRFTPSCTFGLVETNRQSSVLRIPTSIDRPLGSAGM